MAAEWQSGVRVEGTAQSWHGFESVMNAEEARTYANVAKAAELEDVRAVNLVGLEIKPGATEDDPPEQVLIETDLIGIYDSKDRLLGSHGRDSYHIHQPSEVLKPAFEIIEADGRFRFDFAARLRGGKVWVCNFVLEEEELIVSEKHDFYMGISSSFDGSRVTTWDGSEIRKVCMNTVRLSDSMASTVKTRFKHRRELPSADTMRRQFAHVLEQREAYKGFAEMLASYKMGKDQAKDMLTKLLFVPELKVVTLESGKTDKVWTEPATRTSNRIDALIKSYETTLEELGGESSGWAVWNAITRFSDHEGTVRQTDERKDSGVSLEQARFESNLYGNSAAFKEAAIPVLKELIAA